MADPSLQRAIGNCPHPGENGAGVLSQGQDVASIKSCTFCQPSSRSDSLPCLLLEIAVFDIFKEDLPHPLKNPGANRSTASVPVDGGLALHGFYENGLSLEIDLQDLPALSGQDEPLSWGGGIMMLPISLDSSRTEYSSLSGNTA